MTDIDSFDSVFAFDPKYHFARDKLAEISHAQNVLHGKTFYERMLEEDGITTKPRIYPPQNNHELRRLHEVIVASSASEDRKQALLYYLLKCIDTPSRGDDLAEGFASDVFLSRKSLMLMEGIWQLDHLHYKEAVEVLSAPCIPHKFIEDILEVLLEVQEGELAIALYHTVKPSLSTSQVLHKYFELLCQCSTADAYSFMHESGDPTLFEILLEKTLSKRGRARQRSGIELVDLPLTAEEEDKMYAFFLQNQGRNLAHAADVVVMRKIVTGKLDEVETDLSSLNVTQTPHGGVTWGNVMTIISRGKGPRDTMITPDD